MTVKQALKLKNKLVKEINEDFQKVLTYNSIDVENNRPYSSKELVVKIDEKTKNLIELKTKIHLANTPVYDKIFKLSELKSLVSKYKLIDCTEGISSDSYSRRLEKQSVKKSEISVLEKDSLIKKLESQIETIQEELDAHNATTKI